ncbi:MAG: hypothetical protein ABWZ52_00580 [Acidimicrobiales bacterium]
MIPDDDVICLTVPPDPELESVVVAAVAAVVRRTSLGDAEIKTAREEASKGFAEVLELGTGDVILTAEGGRRQYHFELRREGGGPSYQREVG